MIPITDDFYSLKKPNITYVIIGITLVIFCAQLMWDINGQLGNFVNSWNTIPQEFSRTISSAIYDSLAAWVFVGWQLFTLPISLFIHGSFAQLLGNMLFLWVFGRTLERTIGSYQFLLLYLTAGVLVGITEIFTQPQLTAPVIGSTGAIACVVGAYVMKFPQIKIYSVLPLVIVFIPLEIPAMFYLFWWFIRQFFYGIGGLNIPGGFNNCSYGSQLIALLIGALFMRIMGFR